MGRRLARRSWSIGSTRHTGNPGWLIAAAIDVLRQTVVEARQLGHNYVGPEHLRLALAAGSDDRAAAALQTVGGTYDSLRARVLEKLEGFKAARRATEG
jgi:ATP-dependent Clp protease ATP-binding subunit ClpA